MPGTFLPACTAVPLGGCVPVPACLLLHCLPACVAFTCHSCTPFFYLLALHCRSACHLPAFSQTDTPLICHTCTAFSVSRIFPAYLLFFTFYVGQGRFDLLFISTTGLVSFILVFCHTHHTHTICLPRAVACTAADVVPYACCCAFR